MKDITVLWRPLGYHNVFLVGPGGAVHLSPKLADHYIAAGVDKIVESHAQTLKSCLATSGTTTADLVTYVNDPGT